MANDETDNDTPPAENEEQDSTESPAGEGEAAPEEGDGDDSGTEPEASVEAAADVPEEEEEDEDEDEDLISLDDLDSLLADEDPEFAAGLDEIAADSDLASADIQDDLGAEDLIAAAEKKLPFLDRHPKIKKFLTPILFLIKVLGPSLTKLKKIIIGFLKTVMDYFRNDFKKHLRFGLANGKDFGFFLFKYLKVFGLFLKGLSWRQRAGILVVAGFIYGMGLFVKMVWEEGWIPVFGRPLLTSFELRASDVMTYDEETDLVKLYLAFPQPAFTVLMDRLVVTLKRPHIEANPYASVEFYVNADSKATAVEIRDRQKELISILRRALEELTYKEVVTMSGKARVRNIVKNEMNRILNLGRVDEVFIKNLVAKP